MQYQLKSASPAVVKSDKSGAAPVCLKDLPERFLSRSQYSLLGPFDMRENSPNADDSELSDKTDCFKE